MSHTHNKCRIILQHIRHIVANWRRWCIEKCISFCSGMIQCRSCTLKGHYYRWIICTPADWNIIRCFLWTGGGYEWNTFALMQSNTIDFRGKRFQKGFYSDLYVMLLMRYSCFFPDYNNTNIKKKYQNVL